MPRKKLDLANEVSLALNKEQEIEIIDKPDFEMMTMRDYHREKDLLASRRMKIVTQLDGFKLDQAKGIARVMQDTLDHLLCEGKYNGVELNAFDEHQLMQKYERALKTLGNLVRLDTIDGSGKAQRVSLAVEYRGNSVNVQTTVEDL